VGSGLDAGHYDDLLDLAEKFAEQEHIVADRETYFEQMLTAGQTTTVPPVTRWWPRSNSSRKMPGNPRSTRGPPPGWPRPSGR
jgi:hypothetical protein